MIKWPKYQTVPINLYVMGGVMSKETDNAFVRRVNEWRNKDETLVLINEMHNTILQQQAKIDALMLEYCPDDMTIEQIANWANNQKLIEFGGNLILDSTEIT